MSSPSLPAETYVEVADETFAYAGCAEPTAVINGIVGPVYGALAQGCNASDSYTSVGWPGHGC